MFRARRCVVAILCGRLREQEGCKLLNRLVKPSQMGTSVVNELCQRGTNKPLAHHGVDKARSRRTW